ncbi:hypothetical protein [Micromonospora sp. NPDC049204]|uniref:hypothetical protein n=1 Tax=Micromonospora sp. NPDC049204 TaxID=3154351 RepID=UPI0033EF19C5
MTAPAEHPEWCVPSLHLDGLHRSEPVRIREGLHAVLQQHPAQPVRISLECWDGIGDREPAELILLDLADGALLADALNMMTERVWRAG